MITEHYITIKNGETIYYKKAGSGTKTLILVHGNLSSSVFLDGIMEDLAIDYTVYSIDLRGFGKSKSLRRVGSIKSLSDDLVGFIKKLELKNINLLGWSLGGGVVLETAAELRNQVNRIFLLSSLGLKGFNYSSSILSREMLILQGIQNKFISIQMMPWNCFISMRAKRTLMDTYVMRKYLDDYMYHIKKPSDEDYDKYLDAIAEQKHFMEVYDAIINFNISHSTNGLRRGNGRANLVTANIHVMHGKYDRVIHINEARDTHKYYKDQSTLDIFEASGHSIMTDQREQLVEKINYYMNLN